MALSAPNSPYYYSRKLIFTILCILQITLCGLFYFLDGQCAVLYCKKEFSTLTHNGKSISTEYKRERTLRKGKGDLNTTSNLMTFTLKFREESITDRSENIIRDLIRRLQNSPISNAFILEDIYFNYNHIYGSEANSHPWYSLPDKLDRLNENPGYRKFKVEKISPRKTVVDVLLIISTAPSRRKRRESIRNTWWSECQGNVKISIRCVFITDWKDPSTEDGKQLVEENEKYKDIYLQNLKGGAEFGSRYIFHMLWAKENFDFNYLLRLDDDYFLCLREILEEIPMPPQKQFHWGYLHCEGAGLVWPDESFVMFSRDIIDQFLGQDPHKMLCHPHADQMIGIWRRELGLDFKYNGEKRLHHDPPASYVASFQKMQNVCSMYLGIHGTYPNLMKSLWERRGKGKWNRNETKTLFRVYCPHQDLQWERITTEEYSYLPKLCLSNPTWNTKKVGGAGKPYIGREGGIG